MCRFSEQGQGRSNIVSLAIVQSRSNNINEVKEFTSFTVVFVTVKNWIDWWHWDNITGCQSILFHCIYVFRR